MMDDMCTPLHFFLGSNTPQGFVSRFDQLADASGSWHEFVIKGGPGTGKSSLMKQIAQHAASCCSQIECIHCSSDIDSLDGVILPQAGIAIADGSAPHVIEPKYPGALEQVIDLSDCWEQEQLYKNRIRIIQLFSKISRCHEYCCRFLSAAGSLLGDTYRIALDATDIAKAAKAAGRIADAQFHKAGQVRGKESVRFLSAFTNKGIRLFSETANVLCERIYLIEDPYGASSRVILNLLRSRALECGYDIYSCYCPLAPFEKLDHLFVPSLRLGFMTQNHFLTPEVKPCKIIRARRFTDQEQIKKSRTRISFEKKAAIQMIEQATRLIAEAKTLHDQLEAYYINAVDFTQVDAICQKLLAQYDKIFADCGLC